MNNILCLEFLRELEAEAPATRKCLERIPESSMDYKPHEKSMGMSYLALIVAEIPRWIAVMINDNEIDFEVFEHTPAKNADDLVQQFDENMRDVREALSSITDEDLDKTFSLKSGDKLIMSSPLGESISSTINHGVHHRGQLTVYMRLNDIPVPSIYGPSADDKNF